MSAQVKLCPVPTPTVHGKRNKKEYATSGGDGLETFVLRWPTPLATDGSKVKLFPNPTARDWKSGKAGEATHERNSRPLSEQIGGQLNPEWVEWLMGWPIGWSRIESINDDRLEHWDAEPADVPRVCRNISNRVCRLKCIGNGQVPLCAKIAFEALRMAR